MATKSTKNSRTSRTGNKKAEPGKAKVGKDKTELKSTSSDRFVKDLLVRGDAVKPDGQGNLPLSATHGITKEDKDGTVRVKRARFKYF